MKKKPMKKKELIKRIDCRYGQLVIHYNLELAAKIDRFAKKMEQIGVAASKHAREAEEKGREADLTRLWRMLAVEFEKAFGKGSSRIVFGGDKINMKMLEEFWDKMLPYLEEWSDELVNQIKKEALQRIQS